MFPDMYILLMFPDMYNLLMFPDMYNLLRFPDMYNLLMFPDMYVLLMFPVYGSERSQDLHICHQRTHNSAYSTFQTGKQTNCKTCLEVFMTMFTF